MKSLNKIIREEYVKFINEFYNDEDIDYSYFERQDEIKSGIFNDFLYHNNQDFTKHIPWRVIPYSRLKKIWEDYMRYGFVRDTNGLNMIVELMIENTTKVEIMTALAGHTQWGDEEAFEDNIGYWVDRQLECVFEKSIDKNQLQIPFDNSKMGHVKPKNTSKCTTTVHPFVNQYVKENYNSESMNLSDIRKMLYDELKSRFYDYYMDDPKHKMGGFISDYGLKPLQELLGQLLRATDDGEKVVLVDRMLNVVHQRSDIANWFVEGGSQALAQLSGSPSKV